MGTITPGGEEIKHPLPTSPPVAKNEEGDKILKVAAQAIKKPELPATPAPKRLDVLVSQRQDAEQKLESHFVKISNLKNNIFALTKEKNLFVNEAKGSKQKTELYQISIAELEDEIARKSDELQIETEKADDIQTILDNVNKEIALRAPKRPPPEPPSSERM